jgi:hypothetical protein
LSFLTKTQKEYEPYKSKKIDLPDKKAKSNNGRYIKKPGFSIQFKRS